ncbi:hypothetical protein ACTMU2_31500 [Cupriavidus basilensis]
MSQAPKARRRRHAAGPDRCDPPACNPAVPRTALRHQREKVVAAAQGNYDALFDPALPGPALVERLLVALYAARLTPSPKLADHYRARLAAAGADAASIAVAEQGTPRTQPTRALAPC